MNRAVLAGVALLLSAQALNAQITTYIAPPRAQAPNPQAVATADSIRRDSVSTAAVTNMKAWVDSAAGVTVPTTVGTDSSAIVNDPGRPVVTTFSNGSVAPATASGLPTLALCGALVLVIGAGLLSNRPRG